jgi:modified peptide precursor CbpA
MKKSKEARANGAKKNKADIIASRKTCKADGVGLSHYILVDKKVK